MIEIKEVGIEEVLKVHPNVVEFIPLDSDYFEHRYQNKEKLILVAYINSVPVGYMVGYDLQDGQSFYCWMAGVDIHYRRLGILTELMRYQMDWAKEKGYSLLKIKTRNNKREMLSFLVKNGFYFTDVEKTENKEDYRIYLQKDIL